MIDSQVEELGRWMAERHTRRSFLGKLGRAAVLVAGGPVLATLLADPAYAKVCGQSGVSVLCPTFDCDAVWGWCWYSSGCCSDGALKKICDCCEANYPNVHGYCPDGTNVRCIVESCGTDPRVQRVPLNRVPADSRIAAAAGVNRVRFPGGSTSVVVADVEDDLVLAIGTALAGAMNLPIIPVNRLLPQGDTTRALQAMGARRAIVVAPAAGPTLEIGLLLAGVSAERVGNSQDPAVLSKQVADWRGGRLGSPSAAVCIAPQGTSRQAAGLAAGLAASKGWPLVVGPGPASGLNAPATYLIGPEAAAFSAQVPGPHPTTAISLIDLANEVAQMAHAAAPVPGAVGLAPEGSLAMIPMAALGGPVLLYQPGSANPAAAWLRARYDAHGAPALAAVAEGRSGDLGANGTLQVQSLLNGFAVHQLKGSAGQGLPVIEQPLAERPVGLARVGPAVARRPAPVRRRRRR